MSDTSGFNDFEIRVGIEFGTDVAEVVRDARNFFKQLGEVDDSAIKDRARARSKAAGDEYRAQTQAQKRYTDSEKNQARVVLRTTEAFFRDRAQKEREAEHNRRRNFERESKVLLADQKAANAKALADHRNAQSSQQKILAAGLRSSTENQKAAHRSRLQIQASGLRREEAGLRDSARTTERIAKEQTAAQVRAEKEATTLRVQARKTGDSQMLQAARQAHERQAQFQKQADRLEFTEAQSAEARHIARTKAFYRTLGQVTQAGLRTGGDIIRSGLRTTENIVKSHFAKREAQQRESSNKITNIEKSETIRQTSVIRQQLDEQNGIYTRAAQKRLAVIERSATQERAVITSNAVKSAEAQAAIANRGSKGIVGAATGGVLSGGIGGLLALGGGGLLARGIASEATESVKTGKQTEAVLLSTGHAARLSRAEIEKYATQLSLLSGIDDEAIQGSENLLLTFTNIKNSKVGNIFRDATRTVVDMSVALKQDLKSSSIQVGKALNDPIKGITALTRVGVSFTKETKARITALVNGGKVAEAQKVILAELSREFGGSAAAAATAGERFKVFYKNIEEAIGLKLYPIVSAALDGIISLSTKIAEGSGGWKILRDGLIGVAVGLGAVVAVKAGVEVLGLLSSTLSLLAANPGVVAIGVIGAGLSIIARNTGLLDGAKKKVTTFFDAITGKSSAANNAFKATNDALTGTAFAKDGKALDPRNDAKIAEHGGLDFIYGTDGYKYKTYSDFEKAQRTFVAGAKLHLYGLAIAKDGRKFDPTDERPKVAAHGGLEAILGSDGQTYRSYKAFEEAQRKFVADAANAGRKTDDLGSKFRAFYQGISGEKQKMVQAEDFTWVPESYYYVGTQAQLYARASAYRKFVTSITTDAKTMTKAGYDLGKPIQGFSNLILFESTFGAASQTIHDGLLFIRAGIDDLLGGKGIDTIRASFQGTFHGLAQDFGPAKTEAIKGARSVINGVRDFISTEALPILSGARLNIGSFLIGALVPGGEGGAVSRVVHAAITKVLVGAVKGKERDKNEAAVAMGERANAIVRDGFAKVTSTGINIGQFFSSLFTGNIGDNSTAQRIGYTVRRLIEAGISQVGEFVAPLGRIMANAAGAVGGLFTKYVLPKIIEIPRIVGKFLSRTAFSESFMKAVLATAAGVAGVAIVVAGQFIRGFIEGIISRRGDIAKTVLDVISFALHAIIGSGNPFLILGAAIVAGVAGAKVISAFAGVAAKFAELKINARASALAVKGDFEGARREIEKLRSTDVSKISSRGAGSALPQLAKQAEDFYVRAGVRLSEFKDKAVTGTSAIGRAFRDLPASLTIAAEKLPAPVQRALGTIVAASKQTANEFGAGFSIAKEKVVAGYDKVKQAAKSANDYMSQESRKSQAVIGALAGATTGYFAGLADTAEAKALSVAGSITTIAGAFAVGGPIVGGITAVSTAIGYVVGNAQRESKAAKAQIARDVAFVKAISKDTQDSLRAAFRSSGSTDAEGRAAAVASLLAKDIDENKPAIREFFRDLDGNLRDTVDATRKGQDALRDYGKSLVNSKVRQIINGDTDAMKAFSKQAQDAALGVIDQGNSPAAFGGSLNQRIRRGADKDDLDALLGYNKALVDGSISFDSYITKLRRLGATKAEVTETTKTYNEVLKSGIESTAGATFINSLAGDLRRATALQQAFAQAQAEATRLDDLLKPMVERYQTAYGRVKESIDKAKTAYLDFLDAQTGRRKTRDETTVALFQAARENQQPAEEGVTPTEAAAKRRLGVQNSLEVLGPQVSQIAKDAGTLGDAQRKVNAYFDDLRAGAKDQATKDYFTLLQKSLDPSLIEGAYRNAHEAIKTVGDLKQKFTDFITLNKDNPLTIDLRKARTFDEAKRIIGTELTELSESNPEVRAYLEKHGGYDAVLTQILADSATIDALAPNISVTMSLFSGAVTGLQEDLNRILFNVFVKPTPSNSLGESAPPGQVNADKGARWGAVHAFAGGGFTPAHIQHGQRIKYAEPETGGELFMPRRGNRARNDAIMAVGAAWTGGRYISAKELAKMPEAFMRDGGTINMARGGGHGSSYIPPELRPHAGDTPAQRERRFRRLRAWVSRHNWRPANPHSVLHRRPHHGGIGGTVGMAAGGIYSDQEFLQAWNTLARANPSAALGMGGRRVGPTGGIVSPWFYSNLPTVERRHKQNEWMEAIARFFRGGGPSAQTRDGSGGVRERGSSTGSSSGSSAPIRLGGTRPKPQHVQTREERIDYARLYSQAKERVLHEDARHRKLGPKEYAKWSEALARLFRSEVVAPSAASTVGPHAQLKSVSSIPSESSSHSAQDNSVTNVVTNNTINQTNNIVEASSPQSTAMEVTRNTKAAVFRTGPTLVGSNR